MLMEQMMAIYIINNNTNYLIKAGLLIQPEDATHRTGVMLEIKRGLITHIYPDSQAQPNASEPAEMIDLSPYTLMPGLIDCHVHLALDGENFKHALARWDQGDELEQHLTRSLKAYLGQGILAVRDGGDARGLALKLRHQVRAGNTPSPQIIATGWAIRQTGRYGGFLGPGLAGKSVEEAVEEAAGAGADQIKVLVSGIVDFNTYGRVGQVQFNLPNLSALVRHSHQLGLRVMAHASSREAVRLALEAGVDSLEHGYFLSQQSIDLLAATKTPWIPTLAPVANQLTLCKPELAEIISKTCRRQQEMVAAAASAGVIIGIGTDAGAAGVRHGQGFLDEVRLLREAGLSPARIIKAATTDGARILGLERKLGRLQVGMPANLIAVEGNPLIDLAALGKVRHTIITI
ncbi:MAG: amidohydrolase family protein [Bacillota bacterium]